MTYTHKIVVIFVTAAVLTTAYKIGEKRGTLGATISTPVMSVDAGPAPIPDPPLPPSDDPCSPSPDRWEGCKSACSMPKPPGQLCAAPNDDQSRCETECRRGVRQGNWCP